MVKSNTSKLKKIAEKIKEAYSEYLERGSELTQKLRLFGLEPHDYLETLIEKKLKLLGLKDIEVRVLSESRGFIWEKSNLYEFIIFGSVVSVYKYYLRDQATL